MLRGLVGEPTLLEILHEYYRRFAPGHVAEADFRRVAEEVSGQELDWFFDQWFHTTATLDYSIASASTEQLADGSWRTRIEVAREGDAWMPVELRVGSETRTLTSRDRRQTVEIVTRERPAAAVLDPDHVLLDLDPANDQRRL